MNDIKNPKQSWNDLTDKKTIYTKCVDLASHRLAVYYETYYA